MDSKVTVETSAESEAPTPIVVAAPCRFHFLKTLAAIYLSRKFIVTLTFAWMIYGVYWGAVKTVFSMDNPDQIRALTQMFTVTMGIFGSIALGYLGFSRTSSTLQSYVNPAPASRSWKSDPNERD